MHGHGRIQHDSGRDDIRVAQEFFDTRPLVGNAQIALNSPPESVVGTVICLIVGALTRASAPLSRRGVQPGLGRPYLRAHRYRWRGKQDCLGTVGDRSTPDRDDQIRLRLTCHPGCGNHVAARRVRRHGVVGPGAQVPKRPAYLLNLVGFIVECIGHH